MTRLARVVLAGVLSVALTAGTCTADRPGGSASGSTPGAAGIGDPYFPGYGNGGYDVTNYQLRIRYDTASDELTGQATITATATQHLSRFNLDLVGLTVTGVTVNGDPAEVSHDSDELVIEPASGLARGRQFTAVIRYNGIPAPIDTPSLGLGGFLHTEDGAIALGEPVSASTWFPVNDHPLDKATYRIEIAVPEGMSAVSNGVLDGTRTAEGWTTWTWIEPHPMASYLTTLAIGNFRVRTGTHRGKPLINAYDVIIPKGGSAVTSLNRTGEIVDFLATRFGPYPFDAYGGIVVEEPRIRYALETQSRPVYSSVFFESGPNFAVVAHELAHQWFGNSVSISSWRDLWLNEGFASYAEWLWAEHDGGRSAQRSFEAEYEITDWSQPALDPGPANLFGRAVYKRGALTVHALRVTVGDDTFFDILRTWTTERRNGNATTGDFIATAERVSGQLLGPFFDAWLSGQSAPPRPSQR